MIHPSYIGRSPQSSVAFNLALGSRLPDLTLRLALGDYSGPERLGHLVLWTAELSNSHLKLSPGLNGNTRAARSGNRERHRPRCSFGPGASTYTAGDRSGRMYRARPSICVGRSRRKA